MTTSDEQDRSPHENKSEVARLMQRIEEEYTAAQHALSGLAVGVAKHQFITARMENIEHCHQQLQMLVGEEAIVLVAQALQEAGA